jgi:MinD-like ATPase involved in chromosome partitioning or flagellar assembly
MTTTLTDRLRRRESDVDRDVPDAPDGRAAGHRRDSGRGRAAATAAELPPAGYVPTGKGGPLVAVCGLCGGAGASTLVYLLAAASARGAGTAPVLACDAGSATAGLSLYAGQESPRSLAETAVALQEGRLGERPMFVRADSGVRLIAPGPRSETPPTAAAAVARLIRDARGAHGLTVVDCGTLAEEPQRIAARLASHVVWVVPATAGGVRRAQRALPAARWADDRPQVVVARRDATGGDRATLRTLTALADDRRAPLVLLPHLDDLTPTTLTTALTTAEVSLEALAATLRR